MKIDKLIEELNKAKEIGLEEVYLFDIFFYVGSDIATTSATTTDGARVMLLTRTSNHVFLDRR